MSWLECQIRVRIRTAEFATSGVAVTERMYVGRIRFRSGRGAIDCGTGSSHTVCQIPEAGVYQIPFGSRTCLPRGCSPPSVGSHTPTTISFAPSSTNASVMSNVNRSYPPR